MNRATRPAVLAVTMLLLGATPAAAQTFKSQLSFSFADDNVLRDAGETRVSSPSAYFGQSPETQLGLRGSDSGFSSSRLHLFVYGAVDEVSPYFLPEGAVVLSLDPVAGTFRDDGTYLRATYFFEPDRKRGISLTMFPIDSDRLRLGFHPQISWGGSDTFPKHFRKGLVPGAKLQLDMQRWYTFVAVKTALVRSPTEDILDNPGGNTNKIVERTAYGFLAGVGVDLYKSDDAALRFEVDGGYFRKGTNTRENVLGEPIHAGGLSGQLSWHSGLPIGRRIDLRLYIEDPLRYDSLTPELYGKGVSWNLALEGTGLVQTLEDPDQVHSTLNEWGWAAMLTSQIKISHFRVHLEGTARSLRFITYDVPGIVPYQALPERVETSPEFYAQLGLDYNIESINLTIATTFGLLFPATYKGVVPAGQFVPETTLQGQHTVVVRGTDSGSDWDILPAGEDALPVFYAKFSTKWTFGKNFAALFEMTYGHDPNLSQVLPDFRGHAVRRFDEPNILGFGLLARLGF
jgi:hypothetical protein